MPTVFLTINSNPYPVSYDGNEQQTSVTIGEATRSFAGNLRSTLMPVKREWTFNTTEITDAIVTQLKADLQTNNMLPVCNGDMFQGDTNVPCSVTYVSHTDVYDVSSGTEIHKQIVTINVREA